MLNRYDSKGKNKDDKVIVTEDRVNIEKSNRGKKKCKIDKETIQRIKLKKLSNWEELPIIFLALIFILVVLMFVSRSIAAFFCDFASIMLVVIIAQKAYFYITDRRYIVIKDNIGDKYYINQKDPNKIKKTYSRLCDEVFPQKTGQGSTLVHDINERKISTEIIAKTISEIISKLIKKD